MATHVPEEVSRLASQRDLGGFRECHIPLGTNLFSIIMAVVLLPFGLVMVWLTVLGGFPPQAILYALGGYCTMLLGVGSGLIAFLGLARCAYEYDGGLIGFNKRKHKIIYALSWSEIKSTYAVAHFVIDMQDHSFPVYTRRLWKRCREAAASNYERGQGMALD